MIKYGLTEHGFRRKLYSECLAERIERAKETYGVNIDTSETSFLGTFIRNTAWDEAELWELLEDIYLSAFVNYAEGTSLDNVGEYVTISRRPATKAKGIAIFKGKDDTVIPKGFRIRTEDLRVYETDVTETIKNGKAEIPITSIVAGKESNANAGTITVIVNPLRGLESVTNGLVEGGKDLETDAEFRERYKQSYSKGGGATVEAIRAALLDMDDVVDALVKENTTMEEVDGLPPKSVHCIVHGASDEEVAETIFKNKAGGIQAFGNTCVDIEDTMGEVHPICFTRAEIKDIWVKLYVTKDEGYPGNDVVKRAVINYIGGKDDDGIEYQGLGMADNVILSKVGASVMCLGGVLDIRVELSEDGKTYKPANIEVGEFKIATTKWENVVVEYE